MCWLFRTTVFCCVIIRAVTLKIKMSLFQKMHMVFLLFVGRKRTVFQAEYQWISVLVFITPENSELVIRILQYSCKTIKINCYFLMRTAVIFHRTFSSWSICQQNSIKCCLCIYKHRLPESVDVCPIKCCFFFLLISYMQTQNARNWEKLQFRGV